jgi:hypothetical protein
MFPISDGTLLAATSNGDPKSQVRFFSLIPEILELDEKHSLNLKVETFPGLFLQSPTLPGSKGDVDIECKLGVYPIKFHFTALVFCFFGIKRRDC